MHGYKIVPYKAHWVYERRLAVDSYFVSREMVRVLLLSVVRRTKNKT